MTYQLGDKVRVVTVPPYLYRDDPIAQEDAKFFERCLGKVFQVEGFDDNGQLELWTTEKGNPGERCAASTPTGSGLSRSSLSRSTARSA